MVCISICPKAQQHLAAFKKTVGILILIAQKKRPDALNAAQKTSGLSKVRFWRKKSRKTLKNWHFLQFLPKTVIFWGFSWFFQKPYIIKRWGFLHCIQCIRTLLLSYQNPLSDNFFCFFTHWGDPYDLRGGQNVPAPLKLVETKKLKLFWK